MLADTGAEHDGYSAAGIAAGRRSSPGGGHRFGWRHGKTGGGWRGAGRCLVAPQHPGDGVVRLRHRLEPKAQEGQKECYSADTEHFSAFVGVWNAKFHPKSLRFVSRKDPTWALASSCREATRPLQEILMLLRPGEGRKVQWSASPAVSPEILVQTVCGTPSIAE